MQRAKDIRTKKGEDYSDATYHDKADRLASFKIQALIEERDPKGVWLTLFLKHFLAIRKYVNKSKVSSEPIADRLADAINYLLLLYGLIIDENSTKEG